MCIQRLFLFPMRNERVQKTVARETRTSAQNFPITYRHCVRARGVFPIFYSSCPTRGGFCLAEDRLS